MKKKKPRKKKEASTRGTPRFPDEFNEARPRVKDKKFTDKPYIINKGWMHGGINE